MAITESDYLHIHKNESSYLLLRNDTHFHLIRIDASLTEARMTQLLRLYPCDSGALEKLGIHFSAFKAENLRSVVVEGYRTGDTLEIWLGGDIRKYQLGTDYSDEALSAFFYGYHITRRLPPKWEGLDPNLIRKITWLVNGLSIACAIVFYFISMPYKLWSILCIFFQGLPFVLVLKYPSSFTLADIGNKWEQQLQKGKGRLLPACVAPGFALCLRTLTDFTFPEGAFERLLLVSLGVCLILYGVYVIINKGLRNGILNGILTIIVIVFLGIGTIGQLNYLLDLNPADRQVMEVVDKQIIRHTKSLSYECTVILPSGEKMELSVSVKQYRKIRIGDDILVTHHEGAFHIPFSSVGLLPDGQEAR